MSDAEYRGRDLLFYDAPASVNFSTISIGPLWRNVVVFGRRSECLEPQALCLPENSHQTGASSCAGSACQILVAISTSTQLFLAIPMDNDKIADGI